MKPEDQFSVPLPCGKYKKNISDTWTSGSSPSGTPQNGSGQFISEYVEYVVVLVFLSYFCSFCCYCYHFKFRLVVFVLLLILLMTIRVLLFYPNNFPIGTSVQRSSRSAFGWPTGNDDSGH